MKSMLNKKQRVFQGICFALIIFYLLWALYQAYCVGYAVELVADRLFGALLFAILLFINRKIDLHWLVFVVFLAAFNLHQMGLYGHFLLGVPMDRVIHFSTNFALALLCYNLFYSSKFSSYLTKAGLSPLWIGLIVFFFVTGISAFTEIIEFVGYCAIGEGEGLLAFGIGDMGEWNNLSWDLISNSIGALAGVLLCGFHRHFTRIK